MTITSESDRLNEQIGFRNLYVKGEDIYLNDRPIFLRSVSFHEEIPQRRGRAFSEADATMLLSEAKELGANMIRLAHYPQNEYTVRLAERMGFLYGKRYLSGKGLTSRIPLPVRKQAE